MAGKSEARGPRSPRSSSAHHQFRSDSDKPTPEKGVMVPQPLAAYQLGCLRGLNQYWCQAFRRATCLGWSSDESQRLLRCIVFRMHLFCELFIGESYESNVGQLIDPGHPLFEAWESGWVPLPVPDNSPPETGERGSPDLLRLADSVLAEAHRLRSYYDLGFALSGYALRLNELPGPLVEPIELSSRPNGNYYDLENVPDIQDVIEKASSLNCWILRKTPLLSLLEIWRDFAHSAKALSS